MKEESGGRCCFCGVCMSCRLKGPLLTTAILFANVPNDVQYSRQSNFRPRTFYMRFPLALSNLSLYLFFFSAYGVPACHISISTLSVPFLVNTPTPTTSFNQSYVPFVAVSNLPLSKVRPSLCVGPSVVTEMKTPSWVWMLYRASGRILPSTSVRRQSAPRLRTLPMGRY